MPRHFPGALLAALVALSSPVATPATEWTVTHGRITFSLPDGHLRDLGLEIVATPHARPVRSQDVMMSGPLHAFETAAPLRARVTTSRGRITAFHGDPIPFAGGLLVSVRDPASGRSLPPLALLDFALAVDPELSRHLARFVGPDPAAVPPFELRSGGFALDAHRRQARVRLGDLLVTREWAEAMGRPHLAGQLLGGVDLQLELRPDGPVASDDFPVEPDTIGRTAEGGGVIDVLLGELYGLTPFGRIGTYPDGTLGLSAATTSCNNGDTNVPWNAPMAETHPFIGLAMFRLQNGVLEQIGRNWIKHGWFAVANDQCDLGCIGGGGTYLAVGCSDTYDAFNNAERFFLGPREEVDPHTADWTACGSYFDATPVDCARDYFGAGHDEVEHRLEVLEAELDLPGATYYYEGAYYVAEDDTVSNNIGWRECTMTWTGSNWSFDSVPPFSLVPEPGPVISTWGDQVSSGPVAPDDGLAFLAVKTTDLGGGQWHYEYALYNRTSDRAIHAFSVPVGSANVTNIGFHDFDDDAMTDWTPTIADGRITWATDDWATDPDAPALTFQSMFNFRFDADAAPVAADGLGFLFRPGIGTAFYLDTVAPAAGTTSSPALPGARGLALEGGRPNPFSGRTTVRFSLPEERTGRVSVLDVSGRVVRVLAEGRLPAGASALPWDGRDGTGQSVASGVYFLRLEAGDEVRTTKTTLLR